MKENINNNIKNNKGSDETKMKPKLYIGITGSRQRNPKDHIKYALERAMELNPNKEIIIVSGGSKGTDQTAEEIAKLLNLTTLVFKPNYEQYKEKGNSIYFERNKKIVERSDILLAYPLNMRGGTINTINEWDRAHKPKDKIAVFNKNRGEAKK